MTFEQTLNAIKFPKRFMLKLSLNFCYEIKDLIAKEPKALECLTLTERHYNGDKDVTLEMLKRSADACYTAYNANYKAAHYAVTYAAYAAYTATYAAYATYKAATYAAYATYKAATYNAAYAAHYAAYNAAYKAAQAKGVKDEEKWKMEILKRTIKEELSEVERLMLGVNQ